MPALPNKNAYTKYRLLSVPSIQLIVSSTSTKYNYCQHYSHKLYFIVTPKQFTVSFTYAKYNLLSVLLIQNTIYCQPYLYKIQFTVSPTYIKYNLLSVLLI